MRRILRGTTRPPRRGVAGAANMIALPAKIATSTPVALVLRDGLSQSDWEDVGATLGRAGRRLRWYVGDWLIYGEARGYIARDRYDRAEELTGYSRATLWDLAWVARAVESSRRREELSWAHHREVAAEDVAAQETWLTKAATDRWSRSTLREAVGEAKIDPEAALRSYARVVHVLGEIQNDRAQHRLESERQIGRCLNAEDPALAKAAGKDPALLDELQIHWALFGDDTKLHDWLVTWGAEAKTMDARQIAALDELSTDCERIGLVEQANELRELRADIIQSAKPPEPAEPLDEFFSRWEAGELTDPMARDEMLCRLFPRLHAIVGERRRRRRKPVPA